MYYFDYLRARNALRTYAIVLGAWTLLIVALLPFSHAGHHDNYIGVSSSTDYHKLSGIALLHQFGETMTFPIAWLCGIAVFIAIIFSTGMSTSLSRFNANLHYAFTKPVARERAALTTFAVDAIAIFVAFAIALVLIVIPFAVVGLLDRITVGAEAFGVLALGLGIAYMWYGIVQAVTATMRGGSGLVLGLSWGVFGTLAALQQLTTEQVPDVVVWTIHTLNVINPFFYLNTLFQGAGTSVHVAGSTEAQGYIQSIVTVYVVALVALAIAVVERKRMEI